MSGVIRHRIIICYPAPLQISPSRSRQQQRQCVRWKGRGAAMMLGLYKVQVPCSTCLTTDVKGKESFYFVR